MASTFIWIADRGVQARFRPIILSRNLAGKVYEEGTRMVPCGDEAHRRDTYGEHNLAYQEYPPKTAILTHVPSRSVCPWDVKK